MSSEAYLESISLWKPHDIARYNPQGGRRGGRPRHLHADEAVSILSRHYEGSGVKNYGVRAMECKLKQPCTWRATETELEGR